MNPLNQNELSLKPTELSQVQYSSKTAGAARKALRKFGVKSSGTISQIIGIDPFDTGKNGHWWDCGLKFLGCVLGFIPLLGRIFKLFMYYCCWRAIRADAIIQKCEAMGIPEEHIPVTVIHWQLLFACAAEAVKGNKIYNGPPINEIQMNELKIKIREEFQDNAYIFWMILRLFCICNPPLLQNQMYYFCRAFWRNCGFNVWYGNSYFMAQQTVERLRDCNVPYEDIVYVIHNWNKVWSDYCKSLFATAYAREQERAANCNLDNRV